MSLNGLTVCKLDVILQEDVIVSHVPAVHLVQIYVIAYMPSRIQMKC